MKRPPDKKPPPRMTAQIKGTAGDRAKVELLQKEWGWSYDDIFTYAFKIGLKTMDPGLFPEEYKNGYGL